MKTYSIALTFLCIATATAQAQMYGLIDGDQLVISTNDWFLGGGGPAIETFGLDISSSTGSLVPFDPAVADPFTMFLVNTPDQIVMAAIPMPVAIPDDQIKIGYNGTDGFDIMASYSDADSQTVAFPVCRVRPFRTCFPEPEGGSMAMVAAVGLLGLRRRQKCRRVRERGIEPPRDLTPTRPST